MFGVTGQIEAVGLELLDLRRRSVAAITWIRR
jgi:hypothetical protein